MTELVVIRDYRGDEKILPYSYIKDITYKEQIEKVFNIDCLVGHVEIYYKSPQARGFDYYKTIRAEHNPLAICDVAGMTKYSYFRFKRNEKKIYPYLFDANKVNAIKTEVERINKYLQQTCTELKERQFTYYHSSNDVSFYFY